MADKKPIVLYSGEQKEIATGDTMPIANGGTGATTAQNARNALLPTQTGNSGKVLGTNGTDVSWVTDSVSDGDKGDITVSASGATWTIDANAVSNGKIRQSSGLSLLGRSANSTGDIADITAANDGEVLRRSGTSIGFGTVATAGIANSAITYAKIQNVSASNRLLGRSTAAAGVVEEITVGGDITQSGSTFTIANDAVTYAKLQNIATNQRVLGRTSGAAGDAEELAISTILDWLGSTRGQILFRGASGWTVLATGTAGQVLRTGGSGADPSWTSAMPAPRVQSVTSSATVTPNADSDDLVVITAQAAALTLASPSGTPSQGQAIVIRIKDNGTARAITWNAIYRAIGVTLPTTTVINKTMYVMAIYNSTDTKWDVTGIGQEA